MTIVPADHPTFREFRPWSGRAPGGFEVDFVGQLIDATFNVDFADEARSKDRDAWPSYPPPGEEILRMAHASERDSRSKGPLRHDRSRGRIWTLVGFSPCAIRRRRPELSMLLIGIEGDPTHFEWMCRHFRNNGLDPSDHRLIYGAVAATDGEAEFMLYDDPARIYGQSLVSDGINYSLPGRPIKVPTLSLNTVLDNLDRVDVLDFDIQGAERDAIPAVIDVITKKVKRVFVETHHTQEIHDAVFKSFSLHGWHCEYGFSPNATHVTEFGKIELSGYGLQCWLNEPTAMIW